MTIKIRLIILAVNLAFYIIFTAPSVFAEDGDLIWTFTPVGGLISYPAIDTNGTIYVGVTKGDWDSGYKYYVYAVNPDGTQKWVSPTMPSTEFELIIPQPAIGNDGIIYIGTPGNKLYAYNTDGTLKWVYNFLANDNIYASIESSLAIANDGTIYVGVWASNDLYLYAINPDGTKKWSYDVGHHWGGEMGSPVVAADGTIYVVADPTHLLAINPDGTYKMSLSEHFNHNIAIGDNETIYVINPYCELIAVNPDGSIKWTFESDSSSSDVCDEDGPPPVIGTDGTIYVSLDELFAIYPNGIKKWSQPMSSDGHIIGADGNIYIGESILNPDGAKIGTLSRYVFEPALGVDGTFYGLFTDYPRGLCAIETSSNGPAASAWPMFQHDLRRTGNKVAYSSNFNDVPPGHWAEEFIYKIYEAGITSGCSQNPPMYCPEDPVTRAQMAVFLERGINGSDYDPPGATGIFDDCPVSHWAADWVEQFYNDGITSGCSTDPPLYCPDDLVTRAQMAVFLLRSMYGNGYTPPSAEGIFDDVPVTHWAANWIEQLYDEGITGGCSTDPPLYCPDEIVNRAQMAVFIVRAFDL